MLSRRLKARINPDTVVVTGANGTCSASTTLFIAGTVEAGDVGILLLNDASPGPGPSGWTNIDSSARGALYTKSMSGGETSIALGTTIDQGIVAFFRNCLTPAAGNVADTYAFAVDPDPPASSITVATQDIVIAACAAGFTTQSYTSLVPSGYTGIVGAGPSASHLTIMSIATGLSGTVNPGIFDWNLDGGDSSYALTIVLERS